MNLPSETNAYKSMDYRDSYERCLTRERLYLEVIDDLMRAIAADHRGLISAAYNRAAEKIAAAKKTGLIAL